MAQVQRYVEAEVREHYLVFKAQYIELWDKVNITVNFVPATNAIFSVRWQLCEAWGNERGWS